MEKLQHSRSSGVRVFIAEANQMNCQLVENVFKSRRSGVCVSGTAASFEGTREFLSRTEVDVVVVSERLQEGPLEGYRLLRQLRALQSRINGVMLLDSRKRDCVVDAFRCGARGVIFRDEPLATLTKCIRVIDQGQIWVNSEHLGYLLDLFRKSLPFRLPSGLDTDVLSKREGDVARLVAHGLTNRDISSELRLSEHTVRNYLFRIFDKVGVSTRVELALYYIHMLQNDSEETLAASAEPSGSHLRSGALANSR